MSTFQWFCLAFFIGFLAYWSYLNRKPIDSPRSQPSQEGPEQQAHEAP